jgi:hypothetical protein
MNEVECPKCGHSQEGGQELCLRCGLIFAKYALRQQAAASVTASPPLMAGNARAEDAAAEFRFRLFAIPVALLLASLLVVSDLQPLVRIFLSMWVHEAGHAVTAWLCGFGAFPGPWRTPVSEGRIAAVTIVVAAGILWWIFRAWRSKRWLLTAAGAVTLVLQLACLRLSEVQADALIVFGGDAGCLVLGTILIATFYASRDSVIYSGALRWGFLGIGAAAFMDAFSTWWGAQYDVGRIPFGENEGVGLSDPSRLVEEYGWAVHTMVDRFVVLGVVCLVMLAALYLAGLISTRPHKNSIS